MKESKSTYISNAIESKINSGFYPIGSALPPQQELAKEFNTSLRSVREALKSLEAKGFIAVQQGRKATVADASSFQLIRSLSLSVLLKAKGDMGPIFNDLIKVLTSFSTNAVRAITKQRKKHATLISKCFETVKTLQEAIDDKNQFIFTEVRLLEYIFEGADNTILTAIYISLEDVMRTCLKKCKTTSQDREKRARDYSYLIQAIADGQVDLAVAMVLMLLNTLKKRAEEAFPERDDIANINMA